MSTDVAAPSAEYRRSAALWVLPRTLMGGTKAMRKAGETYLPREEAESTSAYKSRLLRSTLFNGFRKTVKDMTGKVFNRPIVLGEDVPPQIKEWCENVDLTGRHLNVFARDSFFDSLQTGIGFILTDMPPKLERGTGRNGEVTRADQQSAGFRPYMVYIKAEDLIGWKAENVGGVMTLTEARILERVTVPNADNPYLDDEIEQIRVLHIGFWSIFRKATSGVLAGQWVLYASGSTSISQIPLAPIYLNRTGFMTGEPPLEDLADINVAHWQSQSDQRTILHIARVPFIFAAGFDDKVEIEIGASRMLRSSDPQAKVGYVEHNGAAINSGRDDLKDLEFQMQTMGLQLLVPEPAGKTATGEVHDDIKENSQLAMMATALGDAIELSFGFMAEYVGLGNDAGGSVTVNTDFGILAGAATDVPNILSAQSQGLIDKETALNELKRRGFLSEDVDPETVLGKLETEAPELDSKTPMDLTVDG